MKRVCSISVIILAALAVDLSPAKAKAAPPKYAIKAGKILTMAPGGEFVVGKGVINNGILLLSDGKIEALGPVSSIQIPEGYTLIDASDRWVTPGIVEAHTHIGIEGGFNDMVTPINPELKIADSVNPEDIGVEKGVTGGVTTINTMPGRARKPTCWQSLLLESTSQAVGANPPSCCWMGEEDSFRYSRPAATRHIESKNNWTSASGTVLLI